MASGRVTCCGAARSGDSSVISNKPPWFSLPEIGGDLNDNHLFTPSARMTISNEVGRKTLVLGPLARFIRHRHLS